MRRIGLAASALGTMACLLAPARAADFAASFNWLTSAPVYDWSGFYVGVNGGWGNAHSSWDFVTQTPIAGPPGPEGAHDSSGGTMGGQYGYNWQFDSLVLGVEVQGNFANLNGSNPSDRFAGFTNRTKVDAFGVLAARAGYAADSALLYAKAGAAVVSNKFDYYDTASGVRAGSAAESRGGWIVGVGFEYGFAPNWSLAAEYDHAFLGSRDVRFKQVLPPVGTVTDHIKQDFDVATARINYRWGGSLALVR